jgi:hypothetical protein
MKNIHKLLKNIALLLMTAFLLLFQPYLFAKEQTAGFGEDIYSYISNDYSAKNPQQQANQITDIINSLTSALSGVLGSRGGQGTCVSKETLEQFLTIISTLPRVTRFDVQGYACIPQDTYDSTLNSLTKIFLEMIGN